MIYDTKLELHLLAGLLKRPQDYLEIQNFFSEEDIYAEDSLLRRTIFTLIRQAVEKGEKVDATIIAQRLESIGIKFDEEIPVGQFVESLALRSIKEGAVLIAAVELKKISVKRQMINSMSKATAKLKAAEPSASLADLMDIVDKEVNNQLNVFDSGEDVPVNIYDDIEQLVEERGNNPVTNFGMLGPYKSVNKIYGSLVRPGNITVIVARAKVGKTTLALDYTTYVGDKYDVPILHFDNGEMSKEELQFRQVAALSGVPLHLIETGKWRTAGQEIVNKVRAVWKRVKNLKFYYYCVAGKSAEEMASVAKRFYYNKVGRGKEMIISFDYLKTTGQLGANINEWQLLGEIVDKFKKLIQKEILFEGKPMVSLFTSVQSNRSGIVSNKRPDQIIDDESIVSGSDRIIMFCSFLFILRKKTTDELLEEGEEFGTHKFICRAARHLGEDVAGHLEPVQIGDQLRDNFINLRISNFHIEDCGDLRDIAQKLNKHATLEKTHHQEPKDF
jgi:replicative DNA helicase